MMVTKTSTNISRFTLSVSSLAVGCRGNIKETPHAASWCSWGFFLLGRRVRAVLMPPWPWKQTGEDGWCVSQRLPCGRTVLKDEPAEVLGPGWRVSPAAASVEAASCGRQLAKMCTRFKTHFTGTPSSTTNNASWQQKEGDVLSLSATILPPRVSAACPWDTSSHVWNWPGAVFCLEP